GAREALEEFWLGVAWISAPLGALQLFELVSRFLSPYQLNPLNHNPLRQLIQRVIDFERLRRDSAIKLFLSATNVGRERSKFSPTRRSLPIVSLHRPVCRSFIKLSRLMVSITGTAAIWEIQRCFR